MPLFSLRGLLTGETSRLHSSPFRSDRAGVFGVIGMITTVELMRIGDQMAFLYQHVPTQIMMAAPGLRVVFVLRDIEEFSTEQTAEVLELTSVAVRARLRRARLQLRERLSNYFGVESHAAEHLQSATVTGN